MASSVDRHRFSISMVHARVLIVAAFLIASSPLSGQQVSIVLPSVLARDALRRAVADLQATRKEIGTPPIRIDEGTSSAAIKELRQIMKSSEPALSGQLFPGTLMESSDSVERCSVTERNAAWCQKVSARTIIALTSAESSEAGGLTIVVHVRQWEAPSLSQTPFYSLRLHYRRTSSGAWTFDGISQVHVG